jgi:hypothetical protein
MAAVKIGSNAAILSSRSNLDFYVGQVVQNLVKALREAQNAKLLLDQIAGPDLVAMGYGDGNNGTANEIGYLRSGLAACDDLQKIHLGQAPAQAQPYVYQNDLKYICQAE